MPFRLYRRYIRATSPHSSKAPLTHRQVLYGAASGKSTLEIIAACTVVICRLYSSSFRRHIHPQSLVPDKEAFICLGIPAVWTQVAQLFANQTDIVGDIRTNLETALAYHTVKLKCVFVLQLFCLISCGPIKYLRSN